MRHISFLPVIAAMLIAAGALHAQNVTFTGQVRERTEVDNRALVSGAHHDVFHLLRTRLGATVALNSWLSAHVQIQDARAFGATRAVQNTGSPAFDLRAGYIDMRGIDSSDISVRLGRQVLNYANERLLGAGDWGNFGQSFDGVVASLALGDARIDGIGAALARNPNSPAYRRDAFLTGLWGTWKQPQGSTNVQAFYLFDTPAPSDSTRQNRHTAGAYASGTIDALDYEVDAALQFGDFVVRGLAGRSISASLVGARVGYTFADLSGLRVGAAFDRLSGQKANSADTYGAFATLYGTNHKFYGTIDLADNASARADMGLNDIFFQVSVAPSKKFRAGADLHLFSLASNPADFVSSGTPNISQTVGKELDIEVRYTPVSAMDIRCGVAVFDGDRERFILRGRKTVTWAYGMITVNW